METKDHKNARPNWTKSPVPCHCAIRGGLGRLVRFQGLCAHHLTLFLNTWGKPYDDGPFIFQPTNLFECFHSCVLKTLKSLGKIGQLKSSSMIATFAKLDMAIELLTEIERIKMRSLK